MNSGNNTPPQSGSSILPHYGSLKPPATVQLFFEPFSGFVILTSGAMAVSARIVYLMEGATFLALIDAGAEGSGATRADIQYGLFLFIAQGLGILFKKRLGVLIEDFA